MADNTLENERLSANAKAQGQRITQARKLTHLSRLAFANKHGIPSGTLQNWEHGRYQGLNQSAIDQLLSAFKQEGINCTSEWLLYGKPPTPVRSNRNMVVTFESLKPSKEEHFEDEYDGDVHQLTRLNAKKRLLNQELFTATEQGSSLDVTQLIEKKGATLHLKSGLDLSLYDADENSLLHIAARKGYADIVELLIDAGIKINIRNIRQQTPLHCAVCMKHFETVKYLIARGADIEAVDAAGRTPLSWAAQSDQLQIFKLLVTKGAHLSATDNLSNTPLHWACMNGQLNIVKYLIESEVNLSSENSKGQIPLYFAVENGHIDVVEFLLNYHQD